jgi:hypothetical protein
MSAVGDGAFTAVRVLLFITRSLQIDLVSLQINKVSRKKPMFHAEKPLFRTQASLQSVQICNI